MICEVTTHFFDLEHFTNGCKCRLRGQQLSTLTPDRRSQTEVGSDKSSEEIR